MSADNDEDFDGSDAMSGKGEDQLTKEFQAAFDEVHGQIQLKLAQAAKLINEATDLSEKYGVPFVPEQDIMWCAPSYIPESFGAKFPIDFDIIEDITGAYGEPEYSGWQTSQVC